MAAVNNCGLALEYVNEEHQSKLLCAQAIKNSILGSPLKYVADAHLTEELCFMAVYKNGFCIQHVPERLQSERVCVAAVSNQPSSIVYIKSWWMYCKLKLM